MGITKETAQIDVVTNLGSSVSNLGKLEIELNNVTEKYKNLARTTKDYAKTKKDLAAEMAAARKAVEAEREALGAEAMSVNALTRALKQMVRARADLAPSMEDYAVKLDNMTRKEAEYTTELAKRKPGITQSKGFFQGMKDQFPAAIAGGIAGGVVALGTDALGGAIMGIVSKIQKIAEKSDAITDMAQAFGVTAEEAKKLNSELVKIDNREGSKVLREIGIEAGRLDVPKAQVMEYVAAVGQAAVAMKSDFPAGAAVLTQDLTKIRNLFSETRSLEYADSVYKIGSAMKSLADTGTATAGWQVDFLKRMGQVPEKIRPNIAQLMGYSAVLEEAGLTSEIASSGMLALLTSASKQSTGFAKLMGMNKQAFEELINTNPTKFLNELAVKLSEMSGSQAAQSLFALKVESTEAFKVIGTLGNQIEKVTEKQAQANLAFGEGTRLTEIFADKNNNLAGKLERASNAISLWFNNSAMTTGLSVLIESFTDLVLFIDKGSNQVAELTQEFKLQQGEVKKLESNIVPLINEYDSLKSKTVLTKEEQARLKEIVIKVAEAVPQAITQFDKYGSAMDINSGKVKQFIANEKLRLQAMNRNAVSAVEDEAKLAETRAAEGRRQLAQRNKQGQIVTYKTQMTGSTSASSFEIVLSPQEIKAIQDKIKAEEKLAEGLRLEMRRLRGEDLAEPTALPDTHDGGGLANFDPESLRKEKADKAASAKADRQKAAQERKEAEARTLQEITQLQLDAINDEADRKLARLDFAREIDRKRKADEVREGKLTKKLYQQWLKASDAGFIDEVVSIEADADKKKAEVARKAALNTVKLGLETTKLVAEDAVRIAKENSEENAAYLAEIDVLAVSREIALLVATEEEKANIRESFRQKEAALTHAYQTKLYAASKEDLANDTAWRAGFKSKAAQDEYESKTKASAEIGQIESGLFNLYSQIQQDKSRAEESAKNRAVAQLDDRLRRGLLSQEQYELQKQRLEADSAEKSRVLRSREAKAARLQAIFEGTLSLYTAILKANAAGPVFGQILAGIVAVTQGANLARLVATPIPEYGDGGWTDQPYKSSSYRNPKGKGYVGIFNERGREYVSPNYQVNDPVTRPHVEWLAYRNEQGLRGNQGPPPPGSSSTAQTPQVDGLPGALDRLNATLNGGIYSKIVYSDLQKTDRLVSDIYGQSMAPREFTRAGAT